jgi:hypothetical protein
MSNDLITAAECLAGTLEAENAALAALDLPRAAAMLEQKKQALAAFTGALGVPVLAGEPIAERLRALAQDNKTLLERAIAAQGRIIALIARAAAPAAGYGTPSNARGFTRPAAYALVART